MLPLQSTLHSSEAWPSQLASLPWPTAVTPSQVLLGQPFWSTSPRFPGKAVTFLYVRLRFWYSSLKVPLLHWRTQWTQTRTPNFGLNCRVQPVSPENHSVPSPSYRRSRIHHTVPPVSTDSAAADRKPHARWEEELCKTPRNLSQCLQASQGHGTSPTKLSDKVLHNPLQHTMLSPSGGELGKQRVCPGEILHHWWTAWGRGESLQLHRQVVRAKPPYFNGIMKGARCLSSVFVEFKLPCLHISWVSHYCP